MITKNYILYKVKKEDTLKSLAMRLGLNHHKLLRNFHNSIATDTQTLHSDRISSGSILYVPDIKDISHLNKAYSQEEHTPLQNWKSQLQISQLAASYRVEITKENWDGDKGITHKIGYELKFSPIETNDDTILLKVEKSKFLVNNQVPQTKTQQLALQCASAYYPVHIIVSPRGAIEQLVNMADVKDRWLQNRPKIENAFTGSQVEIYLNSIEHKVFKTNQLESAIKNDLVLKTLFLPYRTLTDAAESSFPWLFSKDHIVFQITQEIECENDGKLVIFQEGQVNDSRSYRDLLNPEISKDNPYALDMPKMEGSLKSSFTVDSTKKILSNVEATYEIKYTANKRKISHINIELLKH